MYYLFLSLFFYLRVVQEREEFGWIFQEKKIEGGRKDGGFLFCLCGNF